MIGEFYSLSYQKKFEAIHFVKRTFESCLCKKLNLREVPAPLFVEKNSGVQDDLNGREKPVEFKTREVKNKNFQIVHSLAKWKRLALNTYGFKEGEGLITNMLALRPDETISATEFHSILVDQWDWEKIINIKDRNLKTLKNHVKKIYSCLKLTEKKIAKLYGIKPSLKEEIKFIHTEELEEEFPSLHPKERENIVAKRYGAVFLIGIGAPLKNGEPHDGRAPDYDDWSTPTKNGKKGLNGDIIVWNPVLKKAFEISSMGIRVDKEALIRQLKHQKLEHRLNFKWHKLLIKGELPQTIGGGIGQSRVAMLLLKAKHIGEVQVSYWPKTITKKYSKRGVRFL